MEITILEKKENPTLSRTELDLKLAYSESATPSREDLKKQIAKQEKATEDTVIVNNIYNAFGAGSASAQVTIYKSKKDLERVEPKVKSKDEKKPEKEAEEAPPKKEAEEKPKEAPAEEKKEEKPEAKEEKKE